MHRVAKTEREQHALVSRRRFVQGAAAGVGLALVEGSGWAAYGEPAERSPATLTGKEFNLTIDSVPVNFTGRGASAVAVNGGAPGPTLRWREGDTVTVAVTNRLKEATSIHWHGVRVPADMDGVPGLSFAGIAPGETFQYRFPVKQSGTYWYHSHSMFQEQKGLTGALVIEPRGKDPVKSDREYVVMLSDWTDANPNAVYSNLKQQSDYYNYNRQTVPGFFAEAKKNGFWRTMSDRGSWARMNMSLADIADVSGATYTYLLNGNAPNANWTGLFQPGERVRLRFINASSMTFFDVRIPGLKMNVVQSDGNDVEPVAVDEFRIGLAETYDVIVSPQDNAAYTIFAQAQDRSGYARGTLAPSAGMSAAIPPMDPRPQRTMADMGMGNMKGMQAGAMAGMDTAGMPASSSGDKANQAAMAGMDMGSMAASSDMDAMSGMEMGSNSGTTPFPQPGPATMPIMSVMGDETNPRASNPVRLHRGPQVDNVAMSVSERLHDPGDGLNGNGRRVLTYADLRARYKGVDGRPPTREIELHLSGNMGRYIWGFNGEKSSQAGPIVLKLGERVRFVLINDTMMDHPIHLHGLWSELENGHGEFNPYKHTVTVKPAERMNYLVSADTPGQWAFHCHLLFHMQAGMFRTVVVQP
jgi:FtsP/CotA-like multicopper oxidase with cupredoxin domain